MFRTSRKSRSLVDPRVLLPLVLCGSVHAQTIIDFGSGGGTNEASGPGAFPAPYGNSAAGARHQWIFQASELLAAGMEDGGTISAIGLNVADTAGTTLDGFTISMGLTTTDEFTTNQYIPGALDVFGPQPYGDTLGWNVHVLDAPFMWDGVSNIVVQTCFQNGTLVTANAVMFHTQTTFTSTIYRATANTNVCVSNTGFLQLSDLRPDTRFLYTGPMIPPTALFTPSDPFSCTGTITFTDGSDHDPTSWAWDFGDGATDTVQNPTHTYLADGSYTVQLIATNTYGSDTATAVVVVNAGGGTPPAACIPLAQDTVAGIGITQVSFVDVVYPSADAASEGYLDRSCVNDTVLAGGVFTLSVEATASAFLHNIGAWVDWDNNAVFDATEQVLAAASVNSVSTTVNVPLGAALNTPLRLRVMADFNVYFAPEPCNDPLYGQAEDYALIVVPNPNPPTAAFSAVPLTTCDGTVQFTDESVDGPTAWEWDFGDASPLSNDQDPVHSYAASGTYDVTLIVSNANGSDTLVQPAFITVDLAGQLVPASCTPATVNYFGGYGLLEFDFAGISSTSPDGVEGYVDRSCGNTATVQEGQSYPLSALLGGATLPDMFVWIDLDNDGSFAAGELVHSSTGTYTPSATITIPPGSVYNVPVRLRVSTDVAGTILGNACAQPANGQVEDFACVVLQNTNPPVAAFSASPLVTCDGVVDFTDESVNLPTGWSWDFGDGSPASTDQNPTHTYTAIGLYSVTLTATNAYGSDSETLVNYIEVIDDTYCDTLWVPDGGGPGGGVDTTTTACFGVLADDGGPGANYTPGFSAAVTIAPTGAQWVTLTFSEFDFNPGGDGDYLVIFDGPDVFSPIIGQWTGTGVGILPNGGVITSSGGSITLQQQCTPGTGVAPGFLLNWNCSLTGIAEIAATQLTVWPQPAGDVVNVSLSRGTRNGEHLVIRDPLGRSVLDRSIAAGTERVELDLGTFARGCYTLSLEGADGQWTRTIVLN